jgi:hypothetical protein
VKRRILTLLTAFVLLSSSFTFSSCKDCGKKEPEAIGRGGKTSTEGDSETISGGSGTAKDCGKKEPEAIGRGGKTSTEGGSETISGGSGTAGNSNGSDNSEENQDLGGSLGLTQERLLIAKELLQFARNARDKAKEQADIVEAQIKKAIDVSENDEQNQVAFDLAYDANNVARDVVNDEIENKQGLSQQAAECLEDRAEDYTLPGGDIFMMPVVNAAEAKIAVSCEIRQVAEMLAEAVAWVHIVRSRHGVVMAATKDEYKKPDDAALAAVKAEREEVIEPLTEKLVKVRDREKRAKAAADAKRAAQVGEGGLIDEANYKIIVLAHKAKIKIWEEEIAAAKARIAKLIKEYKLNPEDQKGEDENED